jgi:hypothetical protein
MQQFLVKIDWQLFFVEYRGGQPFGVKVPSLAASFSYEAAFKISRRLQGLGYECACVATIHGWPAMPNDILYSNAHEASITAEVDKAWEQTSKQEEVPAETAAEPGPEGQN